MSLPTSSSVVKVVSGLFLAYCFLGCDAPKPKLEAAFVPSSACQSGVQVHKEELRVEEAITYVLQMAKVAALSPEGWQQSLARMETLRDCMNVEDANLVAEILIEEGQRLSALSAGRDNHPNENLR